MPHHLRLWFLSPSSPDLESPKPQVFIRHADFSSWFLKAMHAMPMLGNCKLKVVLTFWTSLKPQLLQLLFSKVKPGLQSVNPQATILQVSGASTNGLVQDIAGRQRTYIQSLCPGWKTHSWATPDPPFTLNPGDLGRRAQRIQPTAAKPWILKTWTWAQVANPLLNHSHCIRSGKPQHSKSWNLDKTIARGWKPECSWCTSIV